MYYDDGIYMLSATLVDIGSEIWILELKTIFLNQVTQNGYFKRKLKEILEWSLDIYLNYST